jgi:hypothetical protein
VTQACVRVPQIVALAAALVPVTALVPATALASSTVKFRLVIEGDVIAIRNVSIEGEAGLCKESVKAEFREYTRFLRGRGVALEVTRRKSRGVFQYGIKRVGHHAAEWTVVATSTRHAKGTYVTQLSPTGEQVHRFDPAVECSNPNVDDPATNGTDLSKHGQCETPIARRADVGMKVSGPIFSVRASIRNKVSPLPKPVCGEVSRTEGLLGLEYEFPSFVPVEAELFPAAKLFGRAKAVAVKFSGSETGAPQAFGIPPLTGTGTDDGVSQITARFIRCGERKRPAC